MRINRKVPTALCTAISFLLSVCIENVFDDQGPDGPLNSPLCARKKMYAAGYCCTWPKNLVGSIRAVFLSVAWEQQLPPLIRTISHLRCPSGEKKSVQK